MKLFFIARHNWLNHLQRFLSFLPTPNPIFTFPTLFFDFLPKNTGFFEPKNTDLNEIELVQTGFKRKQNWILPMAWRTRPQSGNYSAPDGQCGVTNKVNLLRGKIITFSKNLWSKIIYFLILITLQSHCDQKMTPLPAGNNNA